MRGRAGEGQSELVLWGEVASVSTHSSVVVESWPLHFNLAPHIPTVFVV